MINYDIGRYKFKLNTERKRKNEERREEKRIIFGFEKKKE